MCVEEKPSIRTKTPLSLTGMNSTNVDSFFNVWKALNGQQRHWCELDQWQKVQQHVDQACQASTCRSQLDHLVDNHEKCGVDLQS